MSKIPKSKLAQKLLTALELHDSGKALMRQKFIRESGASSELEAQKKLKEWLISRPGARDGDYSPS